MFQVGHLKNGAGFFLMSDDLGIEVLRAMQKDEVKQRSVALLRKRLESAKLCFRKWFLGSELR